MENMNKKKVLDIAGKVIIVLVLVKMSVIGFNVIDVPFMFAGLFIGTYCITRAKKMPEEIK